MSNQYSRAADGPRGFLNCDADEIYCKTINGQCNVYSLHVVTSSKPNSKNWILVVTLSGKLFCFSTDDETSRRSRLPSISCNELDLRNEFPSQYADLEVVSSCLPRFSSSDSADDDHDNDAYLFLACVENRFHSSDSNRPAASSGPLNQHGLIVVTKVSPPWKAASPFVSIVRTLQTSYSPTLIASFPLRRRYDKPRNDQIVFVSGNDRSMHGYRVELRSTTASTRDGHISTYECFLGETCAEFDAFLRRGKQLPGTILQLDACYDSETGCDRWTALGFDSGRVSVCNVDVIRNHLISGPTEQHFDTPVASLKFIDIAISEGSSDQRRPSATGPMLLVCPAIGPANLYFDINSGPKWSSSPVRSLPCSDQFDCITCAEAIVIDGPADPAAFILLGTFAGKVLVYKLDTSQNSVTLKQIHSFLSPVMKIQRFGEKYIAILLIYTLMIFEL